MAEEEEKKHKRALPSDHIGVIAAAVLLAAVGWVGIGFLVLNTPPLAFPLWLFFLCLFMAVTGTALPFIRFLNVRFSRRRAALPGGVLLRQSMWVALFVTTCAWLQIPRLLNWLIAFLLALSLVAIEVFLRLRERAQYQS